jgi:uridine kinase
MSKHKIEPYVIGLTGLSGAGKSFYVNRLKEKFGSDITIVGFDDYYKPLDEQHLDEHGEANYDLPTERHLYFFVCFIFAPISSKRHNHINAAFLF